MADCGGVFSPRMLCCGRLTDGRTIGVREVPDVGVAVLLRGSLSIGLESEMKSRDLMGVDGLVCFSGDFGDEDECWPSMSRLRSRTEPGCSDCMRRWTDPLGARSGDTSQTRLENALETKALVTRALSRAFSVKAACADWMALDVPAREPMLGDWGLRGSGGGARSGSELSHLLILLS